MEPCRTAAFAHLVAPDVFNIAQAILDWDESRRALVWRSEAGDKRTLTYGELRRESLRLAQSLHDIGLRKGDKVVVLMPRRPETYAIYLAILSLGAVVLPGSELLMPNDIAYRVRHAEAKGVIAHAALAARAEAAIAEAPFVKLRVVVDGLREGWLAYDDLVRGAAQEWEPVPTHRDDLAFLSYTSGTTGYPKGVMHIHGWAYAHWQIAAKRWPASSPTTSSGRPPGRGGRSGSGAPSSRRSCQARRAFTMAADLTPRRFSRSSTPSRSTCSARPRPNTG